MSPNIRRDNNCNGTRDLDDSFAALVQGAELIKDADLDSDDGLEAALRRELIEMTGSDDAIAPEAGKRKTPFMIIGATLPTLESQRKLP